MRKNFLAALAAVVLLAGAAHAADPVVVIETSMGNIKVELNQGKAPITVDNFLKYVENKHYDKTVFHRVIPGFMIQGGGFKEGVAQATTNAGIKDLEKVTRDPIKNESGNGLKNVAGAIAMARTSDLDSATSQFFINTVDNGFLDENKYCVFGKVVEGMDVVEKIKAVKTKAATQVFKDVPVEDVVIKSIKLAK